ncbi:hypothetical protein NMY22_g4461 [Coprinellus aureogranulatus]|nr:hypothetical protein NMY22_g4461 [Coprinellus aureogranulatus]
MLLYLLSPTARKHTPAVHNDKHDYPTLKTHEKPPAFTEPKNRTVMKDSEGTEADVTASMALAEEANVPKNDVSDEKWTATKAAAENEGTQASPVTPATGPEAAATGSDSIGKKDRSSDYQPPYTEGPADNKTAQKASSCFWM